MVYENLCLATAGKQHRAAESEEAEGAGLRDGDAVGGDDLADQLEVTVTTTPGNERVHGDFEGLNTVALRERRRRRGTKVEDDLVLVIVAKRSADRVGGQQYWRNRELPCIEQPAVRRNGKGAGAFKIELEST